MKPKWLYPTKSRGMQIYWGDRWIEVFPEDEFAEECSNRPRKLKMYRRRRNQPFEQCVEEYTLTVSGAIAVLDYGGKFSARNSAPDRDLYIGQTKVLFSDATRSVVKDVLWKDDGPGRFYKWGIESSWSESALELEAAPFKVPKNSSKKYSIALAVLRPGQLRFRLKLLKTYNERCCISGFDFPVALEAAHIISYEGPDCDHVQNGLLLRADLHRLFDSHLMSVDPSTYLVAISKHLAKTSAYASLAGLPLKLPAAAAHRPSRDALKDHWKRFKKSAR